MIIIIIYICILLILYKFISTTFNYIIPYNIHSLIYIFIFLYIIIYFKLKSNTSNNPNMLNDFEINKKNLINFIDNTSLFYNNIKLKYDVKNKLLEYYDNLDIVYYNNLTYCKHYIDIINNQRYDIMNLVNSYIISIPTLTKYDQLYSDFKNFQIYLYDLFFKVANKCPTYNIDKYKTAYEYNNIGSHSYQFI